MALHHTYQGFLMCDQLHWNESEGTGHFKSELGEEVGPPLSSVSTNDEVCIISAITQEVISHHTVL